MKHLSSKYMYEISDEEIIVYPMVDGQVSLNGGCVVGMYLFNEFNFQLFSVSLGFFSFDVEDISEEVGMEIAPYLRSVVEDADVAAVLGVKPNCVRISLIKGDVIIVAQLVGGKLPKGTTTLPEGYSIKFYLVEVW